MMLLQFFVWGSTNAILSEHLANALGFSGIQIGFVMAMLPLAIINSPVLVAPLADNNVPVQQILFALYLLSGLMAIGLSQVTSFPIWLCMFALFCLVFAPTIPLVESVTLVLMASDTDPYARIRLWGTIGWIMACICLSSWRWLTDAGMIPPISGDLFILAGAASFVNALHCRMNLDVPVRGFASPKSPYKHLLQGLGNPNFRLFLGCGFLLSLSATSCIVLTPLYLASAEIGISSSTLPVVIAIGQCSEVVVMYFLLSKAIVRFGIKKTLLIGSAAWFLRLLIFSMGCHPWIAVLSISLHGFAFAFAFATGVIYVDRVADPRFQHTAQSLFSLVYMGLGSLAGSLTAGLLYTNFQSGDVTSWSIIFAIPTSIIVIQMAVLALLFKGPSADPLPVGDIETADTL